MPTLLLLISSLLFVINDMVVVNGNVVGVLTLPAEGNCYPNNDAIECLPWTYVKWLESAGLRVVPVSYLSTPRQLDATYVSVNAILLTGGGMTLNSTGPYETAVRYLYTKVARDGPAAPLLWGTCQGFQLILALASNDFSVVACDLIGTTDVYLPLNLTAEAAKSKLFGNAPQHVISSFTSFPSTQNAHHCRVAPDAFQARPNLVKTYDVTSTNMSPTTGQKFISSVEGKDGLNVIAVQFHPEKTPYVVGPNMVNSDASMTVTRYIADHVVRRLALMNRNIYNATTLEKDVIDNFIPVYRSLGWGFYYF
eukprot:PhM_4_TR13424/c0_g1_i1/m.886/K01307/GGH; gamma-glutamyl hydrolase